MKNDSPCVLKPSFAASDQVELVACQLQGSMKPHSHCNAELIVTLYEKQNEFYQEYIKHFYCLQYEIQNFTLGHRPFWIRHPQKTLGNGYRSSSNNERIVTLLRSVKNLQASLER